jgi:hypothetical protein
VTSLMTLFGSVERNFNLSSSGKWKNSLAVPSMLLIFISGIPWFFT